MAAFIADTDSRNATIFLMAFIPLFFDCPIPTVD